MGLMAFIQSLKTATLPSGGGGDPGEILWGDTEILMGSTTITFSN